MSQQRRIGAHTGARALFVKSHLSGSVAVGVLAAAMMWPDSAQAVCNPTANAAGPNNTTITCSPGAPTTQNPPDGYGTGQQNGNTINVQAGTSVTGTNNGFNLGFGNTINLATGTSVTGGVTGMFIQPGGTTTVNNNNSGTISGNGNAGIVNGINAVANGSTTLAVNNTGTISATTSLNGGAAIGINGPDTVMVTNTGGSITATATGNEAVGIQGTNITIQSNSGTISATGVNPNLSVGVFGIGSVTVNSNTGTISGTDVGILSAGPLMLVNSGMVSGNINGVNSNTTGNTIITNNVGGTISNSTTSGTPGAIRANSATIMNAGTITGVDGIIFRNAATTASSITDSGTITGTGGTAIHFSTASSGNTLELGAGFAMNGNVTGGANNVFKLGGSGTGTGNFDLSTIGPQYKNFTVFSVEGGVWNVTNTFGQAQTWNVNSGTLGGTGTLNSVNVNNTSTLAPGTIGGPPGTLHINGSLAFSSAAFYLVQVTPAAASNTVVSGTAALNNATVQAVFTPGNLQKSYDILTSGSLGGSKFGTLQTINLPAFFTASLTYINNTDVILNLTFNPPSTAGFSINQLNVANSLFNAFNSGATLPTAFQNLFFLSPQQFQNATSQLSGEAATGAQITSTELMTSYLGLLTGARGDLGIGGVGGGPAIPFAPERTEASFPDEIALAYASVYKAPVLKAPPLPYVPHWSLWAAGFGGSNTTTGDPVGLGSHDLSARIGGLAAGAEYRFSPDTVIGVSLAGAGTSWGLSGGLGGGGRSDVFLAALYGSQQWGQAYVSGAVSYASYWMSTSRTLTVAGVDTLTASFNAQNVGGRLEAGYRLTGWMPWTVIPYAAVQAQSFHTPTFSETGAVPADPFALTFNGRTASVVRTELGSRFDKTFIVTNAVDLTLFGRAAWAHDRQSDPTLNATFIGLPIATFVVNGARPATDLALVTAGAEWHLHNGWSALAKFEGEFANHSNTYTGTGRIRYVW